MNSCQHRNTHHNAVVPDLANYQLGWCRLVEVNRIWVVQIKGRIGGWQFVHRLHDQQKAEQSFRETMAPGLYALGDPARSCDGAGRLGTLEIKSEVA